MSEAKSVNGYLINKTKDGQWNIDRTDGETVAGPLPTEAMAIEVASVFEDSRPAPKRRGAKPE